MSRNYHYAHDDDDDFDDDISSCLGRIVRGIGCYIIMIILGCIGSGILWVWDKIFG